jgi:hypothetical protein
MGIVIFQQSIQDCGDLMCSSGCGGGVIVLECVIVQSLSLTERKQEEERLEEVDGTSVHRFPFLIFDDALSCLSHRFLLSDG